MKERRWCSYVLIRIIGWISHFARRFILKTTLAKFCMTYKQGYHTVLIEGMEI